MQSVSSKIPKFYHIPKSRRATNAQWDYNDEWFSCFNASSSNNQFALFENPWYKCEHIWEALSKSSLHSYYIAVIVCNKYLTVKRLFRWQATDNSLVLRGSGGCSKLSFLKMQYRFLEDFFVFERIFLNYLLPALSKSKNLKRDILVAWMN